MFDQPALCQAAPDVYAIGGERRQMPAITVTTRTHARPYAGVRQYAVMPGDRAQLRVPAGTSFLVAVPSNAQPQRHVLLAHLSAARRTGARRGL